MIHIVFNEPDVAVLQAAISENDSIQGEVVQIKDDYAVGPINELYTPGERQSRERFWKDVLGLSEDDSLETVVDDIETLRTIQEKLKNDPEEIVWIWAAQNKHDVSGYYYVLPYLKAFASRIFIVYLNNLPFLTDKGALFYPKWLSEIAVKEFAKAKKLAREITASEWELDPDEWDKLARECKGVRLLEGGKKLIQKEYDFYDSGLMQQMPLEWQKFSKFYGNYLSKVTENTADNYTIWRLNILAAQDKIELQGNSSQMKTFEVKKKLKETISEITN